MSDKKCPLCNKPIEEDKSICSECNENVNKRNTLDFLLEENISLKKSEMESVEDANVEIDTVEDIIIPPVTERIERIKRTKKEKRSTKTWLMIGSCIVVFCLLAGSAFFVFEKKKQEEAKELRFWNSCLEENTPFIYSKYLREYPNGEFQDEAQKRITDLRNAESDAWEKLKGSSDVNAYYDFLSTYPASPFRREVLYVVDSLSWDLAQKANTSDAYLAYIQNISLNNISGNYEDIARKRYSYLSSIKPVEAVEKKEITVFITSFFKTLSDQNFKKLNDFLDTPALANFYGAKNRSAATIFKSIEADMNKNQIKSLIYEPVLDSIIVSKDSVGVYLVDLPVNKKIRYKNKKEAENIDEQLHIKLTPDVRIKYLHLKRESLYIYN